MNHPRKITALARIAWGLAVWTCGALANFQGVAAEVTPSFPPPPRLATTAAELAELRAAPDFPKTRAAAIEAGDALLAKPVELPAGYGGWVFYYACPADGSTLRANNAQEHQCPKCAKRFTDDKVVAAYRGQLHHAAERAAETLGWAFAYSGDDRYAAEVRRILVHLAREYPSYPSRLDRWGMRGFLARWGGRRYVQSLDEAVGIIRFAKGYDLTRTSPAWPTADRELVERDLFGLTAETLLAFNQDTINHQTWYNAGLLAIASVRADAALVQKVLTMRGGYHDQLQRSLGADGLWHEGTMAYHNYALQALLELVDAGRRLGLPLHTEPRLRAMLRAPLTAAYPNGVFPAINDSDPGDIRQFASAWEWAWKTYREPLFAQAAAWKNPAKLTALLGPSATEISPLPTVSENLPDTGLAILRAGSGSNATAVFLDYGPHGGGHGHPDKLNITLFANGREWLLDPGRLTYSVPEHKSWSKTTAAHNTVTLAGQSQHPAVGKLLFFQITTNFSACAAECDTAYSGATLRRYLLLTPQFLADIFEVESTRPRQIDWFAHAIAASLRPVETRDDGAVIAPGNDDGYQHLKDPRRWQITGGSRWDFADDAKNPTAPRLRLWLADRTPEEIFTTTGIGYHLGQKAPCLIRRRHDTRARFVVVYDLSGRGDSVRQVTAAENDLAPLKITTTEVAWEITFTRTGVRASVTHQP